MKLLSADGSVGPPHVRVGHRQALNKRAPVERQGLFLLVCVQKSYSNVVTKSPGAILHERSEPEGRAPWMGRFERTPPGFIYKTLALWAGVFYLKQLLGTRDEVPGKQQVLNTVPCPEKGGIYYVHY